MPPLSMPSSSSVRDVQIIKSRLDGILQFMESYWPWTNCHMVNYFTHDLWTRYVPKSLQKEIKDINDISTCIETEFWLKNDTETVLQFTNYPEFRKFLVTAKQHTISNFKDVLKTIDNIIDDNEKLQNGENNNKKSLNIKDFLTAKKQHEVEIFAHFVHKLIEGTTNSMLKPAIVDAGSGKGYLSSRLVLEYKYRVLGIDCNDLNTERALKRGQKLQKAWKTLTTRAKKENSHNLTNETKKVLRKDEEIQSQIETTLINQLYRTSSCFITSQLDLKAEVLKNFPELMQHSDTKLDDSNLVNICLTGLHTCGNLSATCLRTFHCQKECRVLCNVGCCYHLLKEFYSINEIYENKEIMKCNSEYGFPLSKYLLEKGISLGRNARMLASQSLEKVKYAKELPKPSLYYRALLEVLLQQKDSTKLPLSLSIGKIRHYTNFKEYVEECLKKHNNLTEISTESIEMIENEYKNGQKYLELFYLLRMTFAPILETLILLDRLLYLKENGYDRSYLVELFDAVISPRCYAIVAIKSDL